MWKESLPKNCPPKKAIVQKTEMYRILKTNPHSSEDFLNYCQIYPDNPRYKEICKAYALSFYDTIDNALKAMRNSSNVTGSFIGKYNVDETHGVVQYNSTNGHFSLWLYDTWKLQDFAPVEISLIDEI